MIEVNAPAAPAGYTEHAGVAAMPYRTNHDLPPPVRHALPAHAQEIYRAAFNNAWERYDDDLAHREERCHRIAWGAVKRAYHRTDEGWLPNR